MSLLSPEATVLAAITAHAEDRHLKQRIEGFKAFYASRAIGKAPEIIVRECPHLEGREDRESFLSALLDEEPGLGGILVADASDISSAMGSSGPGSRKESPCLLGPRAGQ